jgi:CRISPR-associated endonuclease/helicase Cas3
MSQTHFYSHLKRDANNQITKQKLLATHIKGIKSIVTQSVHTAILDQATLDALQVIIKLHDLGKYTQYFQTYLLTGKKHLQHHAQIGAATAYYLTKANSNKLAFMVYCIIRFHHLNLTNIKELCSDHDKNKVEMKYWQKDLLPKLHIIEQELQLKLPNNCIPNTLPNLFDVIYYVIEEKDIKNYFLLNHLFSLLIEADKLDASETPIYTRKVIDSKVVANYLQQFNNTSQQNNIRSEVRQTVLQNLNDPNIVHQRLFTLTAPTGIGKTYTSLDFALHLKQKLEENTDRKIQIIYALPFINIIEQGLDNYQKVLPADVNLLAHYQFSDVFEQNNKKDDESINYNQKLMLLDTWQCDVVITSFVQFFQTLIGYKNKVLKKFHHLAGSIIILDEVQTLKLGYMPLVGATLYYLATLLDARIILMTATKPLIFELANQIIFNKQHKIEAKELLTNYEEVFACFNRTKIVPLLSYLFEKDEEKTIAQQFVEQVFAQKWAANKSCLIVCNTVNRSIELHKAVQEYLCNNGLCNTVFYLSTNIVPAHRLQRINAIKEQLGSKLAPILIATQVVEAGVDLDFDMGFRDIGPLDCIIQVAGRINRNNKPEQCPLYIVDLGDCGKVYDKITEKHAKGLLSDLLYQEGIEEKNYLQLIAAYFEKVSKESGYDESRKIYEAMQTLCYDGDDKNTTYVSSFEIINEQKNVVSVFIELPEAIIAKEHFLELIGAKNSALTKIEKEKAKENFDKLYKKTFHQHIINIPKYYLEYHIPLNNDRYRITDDIFIIPNEEIKTIYDDDTGFKRQKQDKNFASV